MTTACKLVNVFSLNFFFICFSCLKPFTAHISFAGNSYLTLGKIINFIKTIISKVKILVVLTFANFLNLNRFRKKRKVSLRKFSNALNFTHKLFTLNIISSSQQISNSLYTQDIHIIYPENKAPRLLAHARERIFKWFLYFI